jgi:hypothetical protein
MFATALSVGVVVVDKAGVPVPHAVLATDDVGKLPTIRRP